jgi:hypothetical protein
MKLQKEYINKILFKGWIKKSYFLAGVVILFAKKKNRPPRFCVNYQKLNDITIKN